MYDASLGRWFVVDPMAMKYPQWSPYNFVGNMPIIAIDPDGQDVEIIIGKPYTAGDVEHPYGHAALRIHGEGYDYVVDFGRYGKVSGADGSKGEGIMNFYNKGNKENHRGPFAGRVTSGCEK